MDFFTVEEKEFISQKGYILKPCDSCDLDI